MIQVGRMSAREKIEGLLRVDVRRPRVAGPPKRRSCNSRSIADGRRHCPAAPAFLSAGERACRRRLGQQHRPARARIAVVLLGPGSLRHIAGHRASRTEPAIRVRSLAVSCPAIRAALLPFAGMTDHPTRMIAIHVRMTPAPVVLVNDLHQLFALCADAARRILPVRQYFRCRAVPAFVIDHFFLMHQCLDGGWNGAGQRGLVFDAGWRLGIVGLAGTLGLEFVDVSRYFWRVRLGVRCSNTSSQQQAGRGK